MKHYDGTRTIKYKHTLAGDVELSIQVAADVASRRGQLYSYCQQNGLAIGTVAIYGGSLEASRMQVSKDWESVLLVKPGERPVELDARLEDPRPIIDTIVGLSGKPSQKPRFAYSTDCLNPELLGYGWWL